MALEDEMMVPAPRGEIDEGLRNVYHHLQTGRMVEADVTASFKALLDTLVENGAITHEQYERRRQRNLDAAAERLRARPVAQLDKADDKYLAESPDIDCAAIYPICKARCCKLTVHLSAQDLDERLIVWDYGRPYQIRKKADGYCMHSQQAGGCGVYAHRPRTCRVYDCRKDPRIWVDFEKRILVDDAE